MKKNFTKIPDSLKEKISSFRNNEVIVASVLKISDKNFRDEHLQKFNFRSENGLLLFNTNVLPSKENGRFSKKNIEGYTIVRKDLEKINKDFYLGERPIFGDWTKGCFSLFVTKKVYQREDYLPLNLEINLELIDYKIQEGANFYIIKFSISRILDRTALDFDKKLLNDINILQENIGNADVFVATADNIDYLNSVTVNWDIFPPGEREDDIRRIVAALRNPNEDVITRIKERYDYLKKFNPTEIIQGLNGMNRYFGMKFKEDLVVFENMYLGNAIYMLFENWQQLSQLSRTEILSLDSSNFLRIKHTKYWKERLKQELNKHLGSSSMAA